MFYDFITKYIENFCWKNESSFCNAKASHIFFNKKYWHVWDINVWNFNETLLTTSLVLNNRAQTCSIRIYFAYCPICSLWAINCIYSPMRQSLFYFSSAENSVLPKGWDSSHATLKVAQNSEFQKESQLYAPTRYTDWHSERVVICDIKCKEMK